MSDPTPNTSAFWMPAVALRRTGRKVRPEAVLKNLSRPAQELIVEWSNHPPDKVGSEPVPGTGGIPFALLQLREHARVASRPELAVGQSTLYAFLQWFALEQDLEISFEREAQILAKTGNAKLAREAGETLLMRLGLSAQQPKLIQAAAQIADSRRSLDLTEQIGKTKARLKEKDQNLDERRVVLLEKKAAAYDRAQAALKEARSSKGGITPETLKRIERELNLL
jgi:hypothetical protein